MTTDVDSRTFIIINTTGSVHTRIKRVLAPTNPNKVLLLGGGSYRVLRGKPLSVTGAIVRRLRAELLQLAAAGRIVVTTPAGKPVDLGTLEPDPSVPVPSEPNIRLTQELIPDDPKKDANEGLGYAQIQYPGNAPVGADVPFPALKDLTVGAPAEPVVDVAAIVEAHDTEPPPPPTEGDEPVDFVEEPDTRLEVPTPANMWSKSGKKGRK
jgi:hypothetical protein